MRLESAVALEVRVCGWVAGRRRAACVCVRGMRDAFGVAHEAVCGVL